MVTGEEGERDKLGVGHRELYSILRNNLYGKESKKEWIYFCV